jgi:hypothetical protein
MSLRLQLDPKLGVGIGERLRRVLVDTARVTREIQAPPILHYYSAGNQALSATTATKVLLDTKAFDTHGWWDATNNRYVPLRAGYYLLTWALEFDDSGSSPSEVRAMLYNNFGESKRTFFHNPSSTLNCMVTGSSVQYADGSARYWELWAYSQHATNVIANIATSYLCAAYLGDNALS